VLALTACNGAGPLAGGSADHGEGRLASRPTADPSTPGAAEPGLRPLGDEDAPHWLYVPPGYRRNEPVGFVLALHGSGGSARKALGRIESTVVAERAIALAAKSRGHSWDLVGGGFGEDVAEIDRRLEEVFDTYAIDPRRVGVQGFSDGASYALSLGVTNGDLFRHIVASSPGFFDPGDPRGSPSVFLTHGIDDPVLPFEQTRDEFVPRLRELGANVTFRSFEGGHGVPNAMVPQMLDWLDGERDAPAAP
jgi:phospholipase/carboxylesterase